MIRVLAVCFVLTASLSAFDLTLGPDALAEAIALGRSGIESQRDAFHRPYHLTVGQPPLDYIDVVTPFRRVVLEAEARLLAGERLFGQREALAVLEEHPDEVDLRLELTFHPLNTFVGVPAYAVRLVGARGGQSFEPRTIERIPRFGPRVAGQTRGSAQVIGVAQAPSQPLLGGTIVAAYDGRTLDSRSPYDVVVLDEDGTTIVIQRIDFSDLR